MSLRTEVPKRSGMTTQPWYQGGVRIFAVALVLALCAACGESEPAPPPSSSGPSAAPPAVNTVIDPAKVGRTRTALPAGFEVADVTGRVAPVAMWGLGAQWTAEPPACGVLADPPVDPVSVRGWSASGPGAIVYVVAAAAAPVGLDDVARAECGEFTVLAGHTSGTVSMVDAPPIADARTLTLRAETVTVVEGSTETRSHADTFTAYLPGHVAYVTVVTDPGSAEPGLPADFGATLLSSTVSALRGAAPAGG
ncbi:DUF5642 family protein [Mycolicibacterium arabiense]|nr:DUF5642 family protein [Mycolicibacterium arabiense]